jgi:O-antigen/teichoic acid export membrane protein
MSVPEPPAAAQPPAAVQADAASATRTLIIRNTLYLTIAEVLAMPLSIANTALHARFLGALGFGVMYSAGALCALGFLAVDWGQAGALAALVAKDRSRAGTLLGTSMLWRLCAGFVVYAVLALGAHFTGYAASFQGPFALMFLGFGLSSLVNACQETVRGFERTDIAALARVASPIVTMVVATPVLLLNARLGPVLIANAFATFVILVLVSRRLAGVGIGRLGFRADALKHLLVGGTPFVALGVVMVLQPQIDAYFLAKLAPGEVMGWYAGGRKLVGVLLFPCTALIGALYPTMARLHGTDSAGFARTANDSLRAVALLAVPVALGCFCFPQLGTYLLGHQSFARAEANLRVLSVFLFLVYLSMPIGICVIAGGKQRAWAVVQAICVVTSLVVDPVLVPWTQTRFGNGGLGVCGASVISELVVVGCGLCLLPRGAVDRLFARTLFLSAVAGVAMAAVAWVGRGFTPFVMAPLAVLAYVGGLRLTGALDHAQVAAFQGFFTRKFAGLRRRMAGSGG